MKKESFSRKFIVLTSACSIALMSTLASSSVIAADIPAATDGTTTLAQVRGNIVDVASSNNQFSTLVSALKAGDLVNALQGEGPFTVFAPTNDAFAALPEGFVETLLKPENKDLLVQTLKYHVVPGKVMSDDLTSGEVETLSGDKVYVDVENGVTLDGVDVVAADIPATNGVIHVVDEVLLPPGLIGEIVDRMEVAEAETVETTTTTTTTPTTRPTPSVIPPRPVTTTTTPARPTTTTTPAPTTTTTPAPVRGLW